MPFRTYTDFNSATLDVMAAAYDAVVREFGIASNDPRSGKLATKIVELVRAGERNKDTLVRKARIAIEELSKSAKR